MAHFHEQQLLDALRIESIRPEQREVVNSVLYGPRCTVCCLPTGFGKTLIFLLASASFPKGLTIVVSPLLALIADQIDSLRERGVSVICSSTELGSEELFIAAMNRVDTGDVRLLISTPEFLCSSHVMRALVIYHRKGNFNLMVFDEAHVAVHWGSTFRFSYERVLRTLYNEFNGVRTLLLSATLCKGDVDTILTRAGMPASDVAQFRLLRRRSNLVLQCKMGSGGDMKKGENLQRIKDEIVAHRPGMSGIVFCPFIDDVLELTTILTKHGVTAVPFHGRMSSADQHIAVNTWKKNRARVMCATSAFSMGVNKPDVRFIIHNTLSMSLAMYIQEIGRAGRDGADALCVIFAHPLDELAIRRACRIQNGNDAERLRAMVAYCDETSICRHVILEQSLGGPAGLPCARCDNCKRQLNSESGEMMRESPSPPTREVMDRIVSCVREAPSALQYDWLIRWVRAMHPPTSIPASTQLRCHLQSYFGDEYWGTVTVDEKRHALSLLFAKGVLREIPTASTAGPKHQREGSSLVSLERTIVYIAVDDSAWSELCSN